MAWYKTGTVSVTINTTSVSGVGTKFATNARVGDGFRGPDGEWYEIVNIASETVLAIYPSYKGVTVSNSADYTIAPLQGYNKETADRLRAITDSFANVTGVVIDGGGISMAGNAYPAAPTYSTVWRVNAAGTAGGISYAVGDNLIYSKALSTFYKVDNTVTKADVGLGNVDNTSDAAKPISTATQTALNAKEPTITVLPVTKGGTGGNTQATARTGLGLGTAATAAVTTSQTDVTQGRVIRVGDHGLGTGDLATGNATSGTVLGSLVGNGIFATADASPSDFPASLGFGTYPMGLHISRSPNIAAQFVMTAASNPTKGCFYRAKVDGTWQPFRRIFSQDTIVGDVSQSGGVPTGAIIERGSNSNGEYTRFADGTQICMVSMANTAIAVNTTSGSLFQSDNVFVTWPMPFSATPTISSFVGRVSTDTICLGIVLRSVSSADCYFKWWSSFSSGSLGVFGSILAIGRWF